MAPIIFPTTPAPQIAPVSASVWIVIAAAIYLVLVTIIILLRQCLVSNCKEKYTSCREGVSHYLCGLACLYAVGSSVQSQGFCTSCYCCGKADEPNDCCDCWISVAEFCNCNVPDLRSCCDAICGPRRSCVDCCDCSGGSGDCFDCNCCDDTGGCSSVHCACACQSPDCDHINCLCFEIQR